MVNLGDTVMIVKGNAYLGYVGKVVAKTGVFDKNYSALEELPNVVIDDRCLRMFPSIKHIENLMKLGHK